MNFFARLFKFTYFSVSNLSPAIDLLPHGLHHSVFLFHLFQSEHFPFLGAQSGGQYSEMRCRTTFYIALGRLLIVDLGEDEEKFEEFMMPLTGILMLLLEKNKVEEHHSDRI